MEEEKTRTIRYRVRRTPVSDTFPYGVPEEILPAEYNEYELSQIRALVKIVEEAEPGSRERAEALNCITVIHEAKALLGATLLPAEEPLLDEDSGSVRLPPGEAHGTADPEQLSLG